MKLQLHVAWQTAPSRPSCNTAWVEGVFGLDAGRGERRVLADGVELSVEPGQIVLLLGPSGSGKTSLLGEILDQIRSGDLGSLRPTAELSERFEPDDRAVIDRLGLDADRAAGLLAACGLGEGPLLLRTAGQLSAGQRYRLGLARALAGGARTIAADEFCAKLDRVSAAVVAGNVRKLATRRRICFLLATTHEDLTEALQPDTIVRCQTSGCVEVSRPGRFPGPAPLLARLEMQSGTPADWAYFAGWHYRGHTLGPVTRVVLLFDGSEPVGICVLGPGPLASAARNRLFGIDRLPRRVAAGVVNRHFTSVTRLVLDPRYRGAGIAGRFLARAAALAPTRWVELASEMGHLSRFAEAAGFVRIGLGADKLRTPGGRIRPPGATGGAWSQANCTAGARAAFARRTRHGRPVCYLLDNTPRAGKRSGDAPGG